MVARLPSSVESVRIIEDDALDKLASQDLLCIIRYDALLLLMGLATESLFALMGNVINPACAVALRT